MQVEAVGAGERDHRFLVWAILRQYALTDHNGFFFSRELPRLDQIVKQVNLVKQ
jgi:hypothetical protein